MRESARRWKVEFEEDLAGEKMRRPIKFTPVLASVRAKESRVEVDLLVRNLMEHKNGLDELCKWAHTFENAPGGFAMGTCEGEILEMVNPAFAHMHGYTVTELFGKPITDLCPDELLFEMADQLMIAYRWRHHSYVSRHLRRDGHTFPVRVEVKIINDVEGRPRYRLVNVQEMREQKRSLAISEHNFWPSQMSSETPQRMTMSVV